MGTVIENKVEFGLSTHTNTQRKIDTHRASKYLRETNLQIRRDVVYAGVLMDAV